MKSTNATVILPKELVEQLQQFVQGEYLYIPASREYQSKEDLSDYREDIDRRNSEIIQSYASGTSVEELAKSYLLSKYAIRKIINHYR